LFDRVFINSYSVFTLTTTNEIMIMNDIEIFDEDLEFTGEEWGTA
jgi:hypothetical protein